MIKIICILLFLSSCVSSKLNVGCGVFFVNIENSTTNNFLFLTKLSKNLKNRLDLIADKNSKNICKLNINFNNQIYSTIIDESGYTGRKNFKINIEYTLDINNSKIKDSVMFFYGSNISDNYYSEYVSSQKREDNNIDLLSEKIFYSIITNLRTTQSN